MSAESLSAAGGSVSSPRVDGQRVTVSPTIASCSARRTGPNPIVVARRMHPVGQQHDVEILLGIDPQRRAGEAGVADRARRQARAARRCRQHRVPAERARAAGHGRLPHEPRKRVRPRERRVRRAVPSSTARANCADRGRRAEQSRVPARRRAPSSSRRGPLPAAAVRATDPVRSARSARDGARRTDRSRSHAPAGRIRTADSSGLGRRSPRPAAKPTSSQDEAEQDESEVAVDRLRARRVLERQRADRAFELGAAVMIAEEGQVRGQPGRVFEQIGDGDGLAIGPAPRRAGARRTRSSSASAARLDRAHHQRRRGDHLGQRGEVVDRVVAVVTAVRRTA